MLRTTAELNARGWNREHIRRGERKGRWRLVIKGVYGAGPELPSPLDIARATALLIRGIAAGQLAGVLQRFDS